MRIRTILFCICALLLFSPQVFAGDEKENAEWSPSSAGPATTWTAPLVGKGKLAVQPYVFYNHTRGSFNDDGHYDGFTNGDKKSQFQEQIALKYGITDKWELDASTVYQENYAVVDGLKARSQGLGDSLLDARYELIAEKGWLPETTGLLQLKMPTGKYQHLLDENETNEAKEEAKTMGTGSWDPGIGINLTKKLKPFIVHADFIASFPQQVRVDGVKTQYANYFNCDAAVEYFLPKGFNLMFEANGFYQGNTKQDGVTDPASDVRSLTLSPGIGWSNDRIQTLIAYRRTVTGRNTDANDSVVATCVYTF